MTIYASFLLAGYWRKIPLYRTLMGIAIVILGYGGVLNHFNFIMNSPELYHSIAAGVIGLSINIFGLILNVMAALGKFKV